MNDQLRLDTQTVDGTLTPAKISTNPAHNFVFPGNVTITGSVSAASGAGGEPGSNFLGIWSVTGSMNRPRRYHSTVLLQNGKVLVAGGQDGITTGTTAACEIYDPVTGFWTVTGSMTDARRLVKAILLQSGKVLIIGQDISPASPNCELYDPIAGTWAAAGALNTARVRSSSILLNNGKVLVVGGSQDFSTALTSCELYDPIADSWSPTGDLNVARTSGWVMSYLALLQDGRVLVAGGEDTYNGNTLVSTEIYDPGNETWTVVGDMAHSRGDHALITLSDGLVLALGGQAAPGFASVMVCELFNPGSNTWTSIGSLGTEKIDAPAVLLSNGMVLAAGGTNSDGYAHRTCEFFTHSTVLDTADTWSRTGDLSYQRSSEQAVLLQDGRVLVAGGDPVSGQGTASCEVFSAITAPPFLLTKMTTVQRDAIPTDTWDHIVGIPGAPYSIVLNSMIALPTGEFLSVGTRAGQGDFTLEVACARYSPTAHSWALTGSLNTARDGSGLCILTAGPQSGKVLTVGGDSVGTSCELYDISAATWAATGSLNSAHGGTSIVLLNDSRVLAVGQDNGCELFDFTALTWSATASCSHATGIHRLVLLPNGNVLAVGSDGLSQIFNTGSNTWSNTASLGYAPVALHLLNTGKVLAYGGTSSSIFDPLALTWTASGTLNATRNSVSASSVLPTGKVLVAWPSIDVELYDPATGLWTLTADASPLAGFGDNYGNPMCTSYVSGLTVLVSNYPSVTGEFTQHFPPIGTQVYNTTTKHPEIWNGLSWDSMVSSPAGSDTQIQYNSNGVTGASANLTFSDTSHLLKLTGASGSSAIQLDNDGGASIGFSNSDQSTDFGQIWMAPNSDHVLHIENFFSDGSIQLRLDGAPGTPTWVFGADGSLTGPGSNFVWVGPTQLNLTAGPTDDATILFVGATGEGNLSQLQFQTQGGVSELVDIKVSNTGTTAKLSIDGSLIDGVTINRSEIELKTKAPSGTVFSWLFDEGGDLTTGNTKFHWSDNDSILYLKGLPASGQIGVVAFWGDETTGYLGEMQFADSAGNELIELNGLATGNFTISTNIQTSPFIWTFGVDGSLQTNGDVLIVKDASPSGSFAQYEFRNVSGSINYGGLMAVGNGTDADISLSNNLSKVFIDTQNGHWEFDINGLMNLSPITTTDRDAASPVAGSVIYNSTLNKLQFYNGTAWETVTSV